MQKSYYKEITTREMVRYSLMYLFSRMFVVFFILVNTEKNLNSNNSEILMWVSPYSHNELLGLIEKHAYENVELSGQWT